MENEKRLIYADEAKQIAMEYLLNPYEIISTCAVLGKTNTVDAVQVVRCKDCKHSFVLRESEIANEAPYKYYRKDCLMCGCEKLMGDIPNAVFSNGFCNYGERRVNDET